MGMQPFGIGKGFDNITNRFHAGLRNNRPEKSGLLEYRDIPGRGLSSTEWREWMKQPEPPELTVAPSVSGISVSSPCVCWLYGFLMSLSTFRDAMMIATAYEEGPYSRETVEEFLALVDGYLP